MTPETLQSQAASASSESNVWEAPSAHNTVPLRRRQIGLALLIAVVVWISSIVAMLAFIFGVAIAIAGFKMPSPVDMRLLFDGPNGRTILIATFLTIPVSIILSCYCFTRILRVQRNMSTAMQKRAELQRLLESYRETVGPRIETEHDAREA